MEDRVRQCFFFWKPPKTSPTTAQERPRSQRVQQHRVLGSLSPLGASPELNRPMSASSLLLAWLACICTPLASANVVAGTSIVAVEAKAAEVPLPPPRSSPPPSKCLDTCVKAGDAICQDRGAVARLASGASLGPTGPTAAPAPSQTRLIPALGAGRTTHQMWYTTQMVGRGRWQMRAKAGCILTAKTGGSGLKAVEYCGTCLGPSSRSASLSPEPLTLLRQSPASGLT